MLDIVVYVEIVELLVNVVAGRGAELVEGALLEDAEGTVDSG